MMRLPFFMGGRKIATTRFSRGSGKDIGDALLGRMAQEVRVRNLGFFKGMIDCPKSLDDYVDSLRDTGYI